MKIESVLLSAVSFSSLLLVACGDSTQSTGGAGGVGGETTSASTTSGSSTTSSSSSSSSSGGTGSTGDTSTSSTSSSTGSGGCSAARAQLLGAVDSVASGEVSVLSDTDGVTTLYVDASAGGINGAPSNPWIFVDLSAATKVAVTDTTSVSSTAWDLAIKRPVLYTNDGDGGPGEGGAVMVEKSFEAVTAEDAAGVTFGTEKFFDADCNPQVDPTGAVLTTFSTWYDYDHTTHVLAPATGTWLVHGGGGKLYKLAIESYYSKPDGSEGTGDGGTYSIRIAAL